MPSSPVADQIRAKVQSSTTCVKNGAAPQQPRQGVHFGFQTKLTGKPRSPGAAEPKWIWKVDMQFYNMNLLGPPEVIQISNQVCVIRNLC